MKYRLTLGAEILFGLQDMQRLLKFHYAYLYWSEKEGVTLSDTEIEGDEILIVHDADLRKLLPRLRESERRAWCIAAPTGLEALAEFFARRLTSQESDVQVFIGRNRFVGMVDMFATELEKGHIFAPVTE